MQMPELSVMIADSQPTLNLLYQLPAIQWLAIKFRYGHQTRPSRFLDIPACISRIWQILLENPASMPAPEISVVKKTSHS